MKEIRRYRAYLKELNRAEFIESKKELNKTDDNIIIETNDSIKRQLPPWMGTKIDIYI